MDRRTAFPVALAAVCVLAAGCGGIHTRAPAHASRVTKAQALAFAQTVNLGPDDVPGMYAFGGHDPEGSIVHFELTPKRGCGVSDRGERFDVYSPIFSVKPGHPQSLPAEGLHSRVSVVKSTAEQERDFAAQVCDSARSKPAGRNARLERLRSLLPSARVFGVRTRRTAPRYMFRTAHITLYRDRFSFVVGPAEVVLAVTSAPRPPRADLERRLLSLLYSRAKAHPL